MILKNGQTYYENLAVSPPQDFKNVLAFFSIMHEGVIGLQKTSTETYFNLCRLNI